MKDCDVVVEEKGWEIKVGRKLSKKGETDASGQEKQQHHHNKTNETNNNWFIRALQFLLDIRGASCVAIQKTQSQTFERYKKYVHKEPQFTQQLQQRHKYYSRLAH